MRRPLRATIGAAVTTLLLSVAAVPAMAITGGEPDGDGHPNVAMIVFYDATGRYRCSATLASPTVLVTAAHCTDGTVGKTAVTFQSFLSEDGPFPIPRAADPAQGYTDADLAGTGLLSGTAHTHPDYSDFTDLANWNDVGVIVLDAPVMSITPSPLAPTNYLNQFNQPKLNHTLFTVVGYGTEVRKLNGTTGQPVPMSYPLLRRTTDSVGQKLDPQILQMNGNFHDTRGGGGTCFGDSGGPVFKDGYLVADTSYGYTSNCRYLGGYQRVDIPVVQDWLAGFGLTPAA
ncbi:MAG: trypsin-like serine protease [Actinomycetota bacterium]|nr:trypsin-like serine protease [Actinomycetota bacterium]MDH5277475.1 trypsin-like serine protease [Actinomycetota bacterium]